MKKYVFKFTAIFVAIMLIGIGVADGVDLMTKQLVS